MKMKGVYEANPSMGDPMTIEGQLNACSHNLEKLTQELYKYRGFLEEIEGGSPAARRHNHSTPQHNNHNGLERPHRSVSVKLAKSVWCGAVMQIFNHRR